MALLDIDLDKVLGTTVDPVGGLIGDPQAYSTQKNLGTGLGAVSGYLGSLYKGYSPSQKIMGALSGAQAGRQGVIDRYTKGYMTQQDILKDTLGIRESQLKIPQMQQNIELDALKLRKARAEDQALMNYIANSSAEDQNLLALNPAEWAKSRINIDTETRAQLSSLGIKDPFNMSPQEADRFNYYNTLLDQKEADTINAAERQKQFSNAGYIPQYVTGKNDYIRQLKEGSTQYVDKRVNTPSGQNVKAQNVKNGVIIGLNGEKFTPEQYEELPTVQKILHDPAIGNREAKEKAYSKAMYENRPADVKSIQYAIDQANANREKIARLLSPENREMFEKAFTPEGKLISKDLISEKLGISSDAQDFWNLLQSVKTGEFVTNLGAMRVASPTGGAVGQVSNMEVGKFEEQRASLKKGNSKEVVYEELVKLDNLLKDYNENMIKAFDRDYGKASSKDLIYRGFDGEVYPTTYPQPTSTMPDNTFTNNTGASTGFAGGLTPNLQIKPEVQDRLKTYGF
jgi:hypothetical protein